MLQHFLGTLGDETEQVRGGLLPKVTTVPAGAGLWGRGPAGCRVLAQPGGSGQRGLGKQRVHTELGAEG